MICYGAGRSNLSAVLTSIIYYIIAEELIWSWKFEPSVALWWERWMMGLERWMMNLHKNCLDGWSQAHEVEPMTSCCVGPQECVMVHKMRQRAFYLVVSAADAIKSTKKANLQSLERTERMMVRWMCGVSLKDMKRSVDMYSLLGVQSVAKMVRPEA